MADSYHPSRSDYPDMEVSLQAIRENIHTRNDDNGVASGWNSFWEESKGSTEGRQFFRSCQDYFSIGPLGLREGDQICVLLGCDAPLVLRLHNNGRFKIIGLSYVGGLAAGEALLGSLPENYRMVNAYDEASRGITTASSIHKQGQCR